MCSDSANPEIQSHLLKIILSCYLLGSQLPILVVFWNSVPRCALDRLELLPLSEHCYRSFNWNIVWRSTESKKNSEWWLATSVWLTGCREKPIRSGLMELENRKQLSGKKNLFFNLWNSPFERWVRPSREFITKKKKN